MNARVFAAVLLVTLAFGCRDGATSTPASETTTPAASTSVPSAPATVASTTTAPPVTAPSATPRPSAAMPRIPTGFAPVSVTFVSPQTGWVLDQPDCCALRLWQTRDAGESWKQVNAPPVDLPDAQLRGYGVRFANLEDGYVFGDDLWATHDGGESWRRLAYPRTSRGGFIERLEITGRTAYALIWPFDDEHRYMLLSSSVDRDEWSEIYAFGQSAAPVQNADLVAQNGRAFALFNFRVVTGGVRAMGGTANEWQPPCVNTLGTAALAASSATELVALCSEGQLGGTRATTVRVSHDGGATFATAPTPLTDRPVGGCVATSSPTTIVAGGAELVASFDGGRQWQTVWPGDANRSSVCKEIGFTTKTQGVAVLQGQDPALLMTSDGGRSWRRIEIGTPSRIPTPGRF